MKIEKIILPTIAVLFIAAIVYFGFFQKTAKNNQGISTPPNQIANSSATQTLTPQTNQESGVSVEVTPIISQGEIKFQIAFNTHQGDLNFKMTEISTLTDDQGNQYQPLEWQGGSGGHHLTGTLIFPALPADTKSIKFIIKDVYGVAARVFEWDLK